MAKESRSDGTWRHTLADKSFVEGVKGSGEHVHYKNSGGSDVPVNHRNETTGAGTDLRSTPISELSSATEKKE